MPFISPQVRIAAVNALDNLRSGGMWLVHLDLLKAEQKGDKTCFTWKHRYTSRRNNEPTNIIIQCIK